MILPRRTEPLRPSHHDAKPSSQGWQSIGEILPAVLSDILHKAQAQHANDCPVGSGDRGWRCAA